MDFYEQTGRVVCYLHGGEYLYLTSGKCVGYVRDGVVWAMSGRLLGYFENGWLYDRSNSPALFSAAATGGPVKPVRQVSPVKGVRQVKPVRGVRQVKPVKPIRKLGWSGVSGQGYFAQ